MAKITCLSVIVGCLFFGGFASAADSTPSWRREWDKTIEGAKIPRHRTSRMDRHHSCQWIVEVGGERL